jgi:hypothetical protein
MQKAAGSPDGPHKHRFYQLLSAQQRNPFGQARQFPRGGILVKHSASDSAGQLGLRSPERLRRFVFLSGCDRRLDLLDEGPDSADSRMVDLSAIRVAADSLFGLRRIRHSNMSSSR